MKEIKAILLCGNRFAIPAMQQLMFHNQLKAVVIPEHCDEFIEETQPVLSTANIPVIIVKKEDFKEKLTTTIAKHEVNTGLIMTFNHIIPADIYNLPELEFYNFHPGSLPEYRGADPIFQQIKHKEKKAAVTIHKLEEKADTGDIVLKGEILLLPDDTYGLLNKKLSHLAADLLKTLVKLIGYGFAIPSKKQDESKANYFKRQIAKDITIDWQTMNADSIVALINACNPWNKGAVTSINNKIIRFVHATKVEGNGSVENMGGVVRSFEGDSIIISTVDGNALKTDIIYMDEGFLKASRLKEFGLLPGSRFTNVLNNG